MSIANYTLPDYLKPMSIAEGTALDLRRQEQIGEQAARWSSMQNQQQESQMRQQEFMRQNLDRMQRRAAMARMMGEAAANEASGMDSYEAKETAFLKAAPDLFKDSPEVYQAVTEKAYTGLQRRLGWKKYSTRLTELTAENAQLPPDEQRSFDEISQQALDENMGQLDPTGAATASMLRAAQAGRYSLARTQIQQQGAMDRAKLSHSDRLAALEESKRRSAEILKEKAREFDTGLVAKEQVAATKVTPRTEREDFAKLQRQKDVLNTLIQENPNRGDLKTMLQDTENKIQAWEAQHSATEETIETTSVPGGGTTTRLVRGKPGKTAQALTTAEESRMGEDVQASANSLRVLNDLQGRLGSDAVGALPAINSIVFDRVLGQFAPDLVSEKRVAARQNIGIATQQVLGELNNRGRFSNMELTAIKNLMPGLGVEESPERAKIAVKGLRKVLAEKGAHAAVTLKRDIPTEIVHTLSEYSDTELAAEVQAGSLDKETFWKVYQFKHPGVK